MNKEVFEKVKAVFDANEDLEQQIVTSDGQCFNDESDAFLHARGLQDSELKVMHRANLNDSEEVGDTEEPVKLTAEERIERAQKAESAEQLDQYAADEKAKTVLSAIEARRKELIAGSQSKDDNPDNASGDSQE
ncbi:MAG: hypothetical protein GC192_23460 [Bacteroidetes bacterium]|nr:hypothetical protein [Bacteroidota bacterium]